MQDSHCESTSGTPTYHVGGEEQIVTPVDPFDLTFNLLAVDLWSISVNGLLLG